MSGPPRGLFGNIGWSQSTAWASAPAQHRSRRDANIICGMNIVLRLCSSSWN